MQYTQHIFFSDDSNDPPKDDIDKLFDNLQQLEPPPYLISRILSRLPRKPPANPPSKSPQPESDPWKELDGLVVRNDKRHPS
jgi:hypothetical protein